MATYEKKINELCKSYSENMADIILHHRSARNISKKELSSLHEYSLEIGDIANSSSFSESVDNMHFNCVKTGSTKIFGHRISNIEDRKNSIYQRRNKQYQWLLAEAYELFEDYLDEMYAMAGFFDNSIWKNGDFGGISGEEISQKDYSYFVSQVAKKNKKPNSILNQFRSKFSNFSQLEVNNKININFLIVIPTIEKMRHIIVHNSGWVKDKSLFIKLIFEKNGVSLTNTNKDLADFIKFHFGDGEYENMILLLEKKCRNEMSISISLDRFSNLISLLMSYSALLAESLIEHLNVKARNNVIS